MPVKVHRRNLRSFENTFTGSEAADWLFTFLTESSNFDADKRSAFTRESSCQLLQQFLDKEYFHNALEEHQNCKQFKDDKTLYKMRPGSPTNLVRTPTTVKLARLGRSSSLRESKSFTEEKENRSPLSSKATAAGKPPKMAKRISMSSQKSTSALPPLPQNQTRNTNIQKQQQQPIDVQPVDPATQNPLPPLKRKGQVTPLVYRKLSSSPTRNLQPQELNFNGSHQRTTMRELKSMKGAAGNGSGMKQRVNALLRRSPSPLGAAAKKAGNAPVSVKKELSFDHRQRGTPNVNHESASINHAFSERPSLSESNGQGGGGSLNSRPTSNTQHFLVKQNETVVIRKRVDNTNTANHRKSGNSKIWLDCVCELLSDALMCPVDELLEHITISADELRWICTHQTEKGTTRARLPEDELPKQLLSEMRCLTRWPFDEKTIEIAKKQTNFELNVYANLKQQLNNLPPLLDGDFVKCLAVVVTRVCELEMCSSGSSNGTSPSMSNASSQAANSQHKFEMQLETEFASSRPVTRLVPSGNSFGQGLPMTNVNTNRGLEQKREQPQPNFDYIDQTPTMSHVNKRILGPVSTNQQSEKYGNQTRNEPNNNENNISPWSMYHCSREQITARVTPDRPHRHNGASHQSLTGSAGAESLGARSLVESTEQMNLLDGSASFERLPGLKRSDDFMQKLRRSLRMKNGAGLPPRPQPIQTHFGNIKPVHKTTGYAASATNAAFADESPFALQSNARRTNRHEPNHLPVEAQASTNEEYQQVLSALPGLRVSQSQQRRDGRAQGYGDARHPVTSTPFASPPPRISDFEALLQKPSENARSIRALRYLLLLLPVKTRRWLQTLVRFMSRVTDNNCLQLGKHCTNRYIVLEDLTYRIISKQSACMTERGMVRLLAFMMDNELAIFSVGQQLKDEVIRQLAMKRASGTFSSASSDSQHSTEVRFCRPISETEFDAQRHSPEMYKELLGLLDAYVHDAKMSTREKQKKLKKFEEQYPEIFREKFPNGLPDHLVAGSVGGARRTPSFMGLFKR